MITLFSYHLQYTQLLIISLVALFIGMSKTGVHGASMLAVPLLVSVFGGHVSSGVLLPMLVFADIFGVWYYHRHAAWKYLRLLFPWAALGVVLGTITGHYINDEVFRFIMAAVIGISIVAMIWLEKTDKEKIPDNIWFVAGMGLAGGFTSMVGNLAGTVMAVYFLSMRLPKNAYVGTTAWFFAVINLFKVPFHLFVWHTITPSTILLNLLTLPMILLGAYLGIRIVRHLSERSYRWFIIGTTLLAVIAMLL